MGSEAWAYFVPYQPDISKAMWELREREFRAGRYNPVMPFPPFLPGADAPAPGAEHASIEDALEASEAEGTRSILDMSRVADDPQDADSRIVKRVSDEDLEDIYFTARPTREMLVRDMGFFARIERGQGVYIIAYRDDRPDEILFAGMSYD